MAEHISTVMKEQLEDREPQDCVILFPDRYFPIIVVGTEQFAFPLSNFATKSINVRGKPMEVVLIGLLEHQRPNHLHLFTMTEEHETGANHIGQPLH